MALEIQLPKTIKVLLVDDDEDDYLIIRQIFAKIPDSSFELDWCEDFEEAKQRIATQQHDLYLIDYRLGEYSGLELLRLSKPDKRDEPFILLTGLGDKHLEREAVRLAASDYLVKGSFGPELLSRTLQYAIGRKRAERQRLKHLVELNRSKDEFISIASHQLRTPATGVKQYIGMLLEGFVGNISSEQRAILEKAYQSNERQLRIVTDLLKVAQVDAGKAKLHLRPVDICSLIKDVVKEQHDVYRDRHQKIILQPEKKMICAHADEEAVRMVLENIIDNASKYSEENTTVTIATLEEKEMVHITVHDEGVGISQDNYHRVFEKFSRIDNPLSTKVGGTGLGLYWAKKIIDLQHGKIDYVSQEKNGTTFSVWLPKYEESVKKIT